MIIVFSNKTHGKDYRGVKKIVFSLLLIGGHGSSLDVA